MFQTIDFEPPHLIYTNIPSISLKHMLISNDILNNILLYVHQLYFSYFS